MAVYSPAPAVRTVAQKVIDKWHPDLRAIRIEYIFRDKAPSKRGRLVLGTAKRVTGVNSLLATPDAVTSEDLDFFLVTIAEDWWMGATPAQREALVDHELEHCKVVLDDDGLASLTLRGHDLEAFLSEIPRHGLWRDDIEMFVTSLPAEQLEFLAPGGDLDVTITHARADGTTASVETTTGEISRAADLLRHGTGLFAGDETPGQDGDDPPD